MYFHDTNNSILNNNKIKIEIDDKNKVIYIKDKNIELKNNVIFPKDYQVKFLPGTNITFKGNSSIVSYSSIILNGSKSDPIKISSESADSSGILIINSDKPSYFDHVYVENLENFMPGLKFTSGVTFYNSDIYINNSVFKNNKSGDDLLNIINGKYIINNTKFENSFSDAIDIDFADGEILNSEFLNCGMLNKNGDCIDFSGSSSKISNSKINNAGDKGISVGEASQVEVNNLLVKNAHSCVVSKDLSVLK